MSEIPYISSADLRAKDRDWSEYPLGTKAHAYNGGCWFKTDRGWKWNGHLSWSNGGTFDQPGADAFGRCIELPATAQADNFSKQETP